MMKGVYYILELSSKRLGTHVMAIRVRKRSSLRRNITK